jgi:hypothetical protein
MRYRELQELLATGLHPLVQFNSKIEDCDVFGQPGMLAKITGFKPERDKVSAICIDYSVAKEHNLALQSHSWWINGVAGLTGTIFEAGLMKPDRMQEEMYVDTPDDIALPFDLAAKNGTPMGDYVEEKTNGDTNLTYVEWLEAEYTRMQAEILHVAQTSSGSSL